MIKKILLIIPPLRLESVPCFTYSLPVIASALEKAGYEVEILDFELYKHEINKIDISKLILSKDFDIVGMSGLITSYTFIQKIIHIIKKQYPKKKVILGGALASSIPEHALNVMGADIIVYGEGVVTIVNLMNALNTKQDLKSVKGIYYKDDEEIIKTEPQPLIRNLDEIPRAAYHLMDMEKYINPNPIAGFKRNLPFFTSLGCTGRCTFCFRLYGKCSYRLYSTSRVIKDMKFLIKKYKIRHFEFEDEHFLVAKERVKGLCKEIIKQKLRVSWSCISRADSITPEIVEVIKKAGCVFVGIGIESGSQTILDNMKKDVKVDQIKKALRILRKAKLAHGGTMMFGMVGENKQTIQETIDFCKEMKHDTPFFWTTPYPGTEIYNNLKNEGRIKDEKAFFMQLSDAYKFIINLTDFSDEEAKWWKNYLQKQIKIPLLKNLMLRLKYKGLWNIDFQIYDFLQRKLFPYKYFEYKYISKKES